jgi:hypothetical protein
VLRRTLAIAVVVAGCGRVGFDQTTRGVDDAAGDAPSDARADAMADAAEPVGPFGPASPVGGGVNTASAEDDPALTADMLEIWFDSSRAGGKGGGELWMATRPDLGSPFGAAVDVMALNTAGDDATPDLSPDGLTVWWVTAGSLGAKDIFVATRPTRTGTWSAPADVTQVSSAGDEAGPSVVADGLTMFLATDKAGTDDLYVSERTTTTSVWGVPTKITELSTSSGDGEPWVNEARTFIVFSSNRPGGAGGFDLWQARRASPADPWGAPTRVTELDTSADETDPWLSPDEHVIYFARGDDIYSASR